MSSLLELGECYTHGGSFKAVWEGFSGKVMVKIMNDTEEATK